MTTGPNSGDTPTGAAQPASSPKPDGAAPSTVTVTPASGPATKTEQAPAQAATQTVATPPSTPPKASGPQSLSARVKGTPAAPPPKPPAPPTAASEDSSGRWSAAGYIRFGLIWVLILGGGLGTWSATAKLSGAVIASGQMRVLTNRQVVQHQDGGVVSEILVRDGDTVEAGDVLIRLDDTLLRSELIALESQLYEIMARRGRLEAIEYLRDEVTFDPELLQAAGQSIEVANLVQGQADLFRAQVGARTKEKEVLSERKDQFSDQIEGAEEQIKALGIQVGFIEEEIEDKRRLLEQDLIRKPELLALQREQARLYGQSGQLKAQVAQLRGQISQVDIELLRMDATVLEEALTEKRELGYREDELKERRRSLIEQLSRLNIRAPRSGRVLNSAVHAIKAVVRPAEPIMYVIPNDSSLIVDARIDPLNIDEVFTGQEAVLRLSALNSRTTPELFGTVKNVAADIVTDEQTGMQYYSAEVELVEGELEKLEGQELIAGMPVETFIQTGERTLLEYIMKPIMDYLERSVRES